MKIREYKDSDQEDFVRLTEALHRYIISIDSRGFLRFLEDHREDYANDYLDNAKKSGGMVLVVETGGRVVAFGVGVIAESIPANEYIFDPEKYKVGILRSIFIEEGFRGKGVGTQLVKRFENFFKEKGCDYMKMEVLSPNIKAYELYKKLGYEDYTRHVIKKL